MWAHESHVGIVELRIQASTLRGELLKAYGSGYWASGLKGLGRFGLEVGFGGVAAWGGAPKATLAIAAVVVIVVVVVVVAIVEDVEADTAPKALPEKLDLHGNRKLE